MGDHDLARRAMRAAGWRQPGGQLRDQRGVLWIASDEADWNAGGPGDPLPVLSDPATLGVLLAAVRERWDDPTICAAHTARWYVAARGGREGWSGDTEAEALVRALEAS